MIFVRFSSQLQYSNINKDIKVYFSNEYYNAKQGIESIILRTSSFFIELGFISRLHFVQRNTTAQFSIMNI